MSFILTDEEYEYAKKMLSKSDELFAKQDCDLSAEGYSAEDRKRLGSASITYAKQCQEEIAFYEQLKAGKIVESFDILQLPRMLSCLRIASGLSQQELAARLGKTVKQQKTSERHEFHGLQLKQIQQVLDVLPVDVTIVAEDVVTGLPLARFQPKDFCFKFTWIQRKQCILSEESLLARLEEERVLAFVKQRQDYLDCVLIQLNAAEFANLMRESKDVTVDVAAILGKILRVNFTVKAKILR